MPRKIRTQIIAIMAAPCPEDYYFMAIILTPILTGY